jgi:hypothetical protein
MRHKFVVHSGIIRNSLVNEFLVLCHGITWIHLLSYLFFLFLCIKLTISSIVKICLIVYYYQLFSNVLCTIV